jgi:glycosyltransferase involved in cell wall biosynthesis
MRITIVYRYFWPDTPPYAVMLKEMTRWLAEAGHDVEMLTAQPSYKPEARIASQPWVENIDGVKVRRLWLFGESGRGLLRALNSLLFVLKSFLVILLGPRCDVVWTATMPPVLQAFLLCLAARLRGASFIYQMQDIYPEVAETMGLGLPRPLARLLKGLDNWTLRRAAAVVVLSEDMASTIRARVGGGARLHIINNFALVTDGTPRRGKRKPGPVRFLFAGNLGRYQCLPELVSAFSRIPRETAELLLLGDGAMKAELVDLAGKGGSGNIRFVGHVPPAEAFRHMQEADSGIVSLAPGLYRCAFPSKILTYMAASLPLLVLVESGSSLARLVAEHGLGQTVDATASHEALAAAITAEANAIAGGKIYLPPPGELYHPAGARVRWLSLLDTLGEMRKGGAAP